LLAIVRRPVVAQTYEETRFERRLEEAGIGFCESLGITGLLELFAK
jgi:hypothetical protein